MWRELMPAILVWGLLALSAGPGSSQTKVPDPWEPVRFLVGTWDGTSSGEPGGGTAQRTYSFVLKDRFIYEKNISTYPPQEKNPKGEVHEHWSLISYDRIRKVLVMRQFHQEGFVNQYTLNPAASTTKNLVFDSERFENYDNNARARETLEVISPNEFVETFELGDPGKPLQVYSKNRFTRAK